MCVVAPHVPLSGDLADNPGMCLDWESNWQPFGSQASTQSTEPHQTGPHKYFQCHSVDYSWDYWYNILILLIC